MISCVIHVIDLTDAQREMHHPYPVTCERLLIMFRRPALFNHAAHIIVSSEDFMEQCHADPEVKAKTPEQPNPVVHAGFC